MTIICDVIQTLDLSVIPEGTSITVLSRLTNSVEIKVTHDDQLTLLRLVRQVWGIEPDNYDTIDLV